MRTAQAIKQETENMSDDINAMRAFVGLPPIEPRPRPHWESIAIYRRPTNGRALILLLLKEAAYERKRIARHKWKFSTTYKAEKMAVPRQILAEVRQLRAALGAELRLP